MLSVLFSDLDRTLLPNGLQPENSGARQRLFQYLQKHHVKLVYVSGRDIGLVTSAMEEYQLPCPDAALCDVGSTLYLGQQNKWRRDEGWWEMLAQVWPDKAAMRIREMLSPEKGLTLQEDEKQNRYKLSYYLKPTGDIDHLLYEAKQTLEDAGLPSNLIYSEDETTHTGLLDILPATANKLNAIRYLMERWGIKREQAMFSGDSGNDVDVLCSDIPAVLVANATDEVRQQTLDACQANNESQSIHLAKELSANRNGCYADGIMQGIERFYPIGPSD